MSEQTEAKAKKWGVLKMWITPKRVIGVVIVLVLMIGAIWSKDYFFTESKTTKLGFENIGELATQVAYCTEVNVIDKSRDFWFTNLTIPWTQSKYIYSYDVAIKAGFDFEAVQWSVNDTTIEIKLPEVKVLDNEMNFDSFKVYHEKESIFTPIKMDEQNAALKELKERAQEDAIANGLLENARSNAEVLLKGFFASAYDLEQYELKFIDQ